MALFHFFPRSDALARTRKDARGSHTEHKRHGQRDQRSHEIRLDDHQKDHAYKGQATGLDQGPHNGISDLALQLCWDRFCVS